MTLLALDIARRQDYTSRTHRSDMKTGDQLQDSQGTTWTVDTHLGRGVWGRSWLARSGDGQVAVLKLPLRPADFPLLPIADAVQLAGRAAEVAGAVSAFLLARTSAHLVRPYATVTHEGGEGFVLPRLHADFESRLTSSLPLTDALDLVARTLQALADLGVVHGNLRPSNLLLGDGGVLVFADPRPAGVGAAWAALEPHVPSRPPYRPPEAADAADPQPGWDAWALCSALYRASSAVSSADDPRRGPVVDLPRQGLDRVAIATVKDAAAARLRTERANPRFAARATERLGALLNRGLSLATEPSPPYRFRTVADLLPRVQEVQGLIRPAVESVSRPMMGPAGAPDGAFEAGQPVEIAVNVGTTAGVTAEDDLACGVQLRDLDAPGESDARLRVPNARFTIKRYPTGRWRYQFTLPDIPPGRYQVRLAFMVKGAEGEAQVSEGGVTVRPQPGYVPPASTDTPPTPIPLPPTRRALPDEERPSSPADDEGPIGDVIPLPRRGAAPVRPSDEAWSAQARTSPPADVDAPVKLPELPRPPEPAAVVVPTIAAPPLPSWSPAEAPPTAWTPPPPPPVRLAEPTEWHDPGPTTPGAALPPVPPRPTPMSTPAAPWSPPAPPPPPERPLADYPLPGGLEDGFDELPIDDFEDLRRGAGWSDALRAVYERLLHAVGGDGLTAMLAVFAILGFSLLLLVFLFKTLLG